MSLGHALPDAAGLRGRLSIAPRVGAMEDDMQIEIVTKPANGAPVRLLSRQAVCAQVGFGKSKLYAMMKAGEFPKPHHIDVGLLRWRSDEIDAWIASRAPAIWGVSDEAERVSDGRRGT